MPRNIVTMTMSFSAERYDYSCAVEDFLVIREVNKMRCARVV